MSATVVRIPLLLLLLLLPLAVAGHNIGTGVVALALFAQIYMRRRELPLAALARDFAAPLGLSLGFVALLALATVLNPGNLDKSWGSLIFGHAIWALLPPVVFLAQPPLSQADWRGLGRCLAFVTAVMGAVAVAQSVWGFRIQGAEFVAGPLRAQGFYSHPLTFAYVGLLLFPVGCVQVARRPKSVAAWGQFLGALAIVYASQSRTVQAVCFAVLALNVLYFAKGRIRLMLMGVAAVAILVVGVTDNPMRARFLSTLSGGHDVRSGYADDRLAFWHAHWEMVKERPVLGHGDHLNTAYRARFYERIGLGGFERMYEAHNMYLQVLVNAGGVGLFVFLGWIGWYWRRSGQLARYGVGGKIALETWAAVLLAALTQNAFQDSEVRYAMTLLCTAIWMATASTAGTEASKA